MIASLCLHLLVLPILSPIIANLLYIAFCIDAMSLSAVSVALLNFYVETKNHPLFVLNEYCTKKLS